MKKYWIERRHEEVYLVGIEANSEEEALQIAEETDGCDWDSVDQSEYKYKIVDTEV